MFRFFWKSRTGIKGLDKIILRLITVSFESSFPCLVFVLLTNLTVLLKVPCLPLWLEHPLILSLERLFQLLCIFYGHAIWAFDYDIAQLVSLVSASIRLSPHTLQP